MNHKKISIVEESGSRWIVYPDGDIAYLEQARSSKRAAISKVLGIAVVLTAAAFGADSCMDRFSEHRYIDMHGSGAASVVALLEHHGLMVHDVLKIDSIALASRDGGDPDGDGPPDEGGGEDETRSVKNDIGLPSPRAPKPVTSLHVLPVRNGNQPSPSVPLCDTGISPAAIYHPRA